MSAIRHAVDVVMRNISSKTLRLAFLKNTDNYKIETTLERQIEDLVIKPIVLKDTNLIGGTTITIPVDSCYQQQYYHNETSHNIIISVPLELTNNRKIIEPLGITSNTNNIGSSKGDGLMTNLGNKIMDQYDAPTVGLSITDLELVATNTILVYTNVVALYNAYLRVEIENNNNFSNLNRKTIRPFGQLVLLATKMYIYTKLNVELESGALYNGHELGKVTTEIESFESASEEYETFLNEKWGKLMFMNDSVSMSRFIGNMIDPNI